MLIVSFMMLLAINVLQRWSELAGSRLDAFTMAIESQREPQDSRARPPIRRLGQSRR